MTSKRRKIEFHRLTISGLAVGTAYDELIRDCRKQVSSLSNATLSLGAKTHALYDAVIVNDFLRLRFISYATGHRPDILDMEKFSIYSNPLPETQTSVEWTHCLGGAVPHGYRLLVEKVQSGIWPKSIEKYLQWLLGRTHLDGTNRESPIVVSLEAEPGAEFIDRIDRLSRVKSATFRIVRPNPGWKDLEEELARESDESDAHRTDLSMTARRGASLSKQRGILGAIRQRFLERKLDYARVEGEREGQPEVFDTARHGLAKFVNLQTDEFGQVSHDHAWKIFERLFRDTE